MGRTWVSLLLVAFAMGGCERQNASETTVADVVEATPPTHDAPSIQTLRDTHAFATANEGGMCSSDADCDAPLRCFDATCVWPPSMTGDIVEGMPSVTFAGDRLTQVTYYLEWVDEPEQMARGLMFRNSMVEDMGMIFDFREDGARQFWMRNTLLPLDMIFVNDALEVVSFIENATPQTDTPRRSEGPARYVIELKAGEVARIGLQPGSTVTLQGQP